MHRVEELILPFSLLTVIERAASPHSIEFWNSQRDRKETKFLGQPAVCDDSITRWTHTHSKLNINGIKRMCIALLLRIERAKQSNSTAEALLDGQPAVTQFYLFFI